MLLCINGTYLAAPKCYLLFAFCCIQISGILVKLYLKMWMTTFIILEWKKVILSSSVCVYEGWVWMWMWVWVCGWVEVHLLVYLGVCISDRRRHMATLTYQHHASTIATHPHPHSTSTHLTNYVQIFAHHPKFRNFPFIYFSCWDINWHNFVKIWSILIR